MSSEPDNPWIIYGPLVGVGVVVLTLMAMSPTSDTGSAEPAQAQAQPTPRPVPRPTPTPPAAGETAGARHVLVQYQGSMRAGPTITRSREEATARANEVIAKARAGEDFAALAREYSDGPSGPRGGDLGVFPRGRMVPAFDDAAFALEVDAVSAIVETPFGFHVIQRYQ
jgi:hypothetical protein